jgi:hypothetical protein
MLVLAWSRLLSSYSSCPFSSIHPHSSFRLLSSSRSFPFLLLLPIQLGLAKFTFEEFFLVLLVVAMAMVSG